METTGNDLKTGNHSDDNQVLHMIFTDVFKLTSKESNIGMLGVIRAACHPADLLSQSLQGVHLRSQMRLKVNKVSRQCSDVKTNNVFEMQLRQEMSIPGLEGNV